MSTGIYSPFTGQAHPDLEARAWEALAGAMRRLITSIPPGPTVEPDAREGDLIEVIQPDGGRETYRLTDAQPAADKSAVTFRVERADGGDLR